MMLESMQTLLKKIEDINADVTLHLVHIFDYHIIVPIGIKRVWATGQVAMMKLG
jgi:hypothetical protein